MKKRFVVIMMAALVVALCVPPAFSQAMATVKGTVKDMQGKPLQGATVEYFNSENGRKYELKTDKSGNYFSIGVAPGSYKVTLYGPNKQMITYWSGVPVRLSEAENTFDIDLQKEQAKAQSQMSEEQKKKIEEAKKENEKIKGLNDKLALKKQQTDAGQYDAALQTMQEAVALDTTHHVIWYNLGDAYVNAAKHNADKAAAKEQYAKAAEAYSKAIELAKSAPKQPTPDQLGAYYNNLGEAYVRAGDTQKAMDAYQSAATTDPAGAGKYYFNMGAVLTNSGKIDEANTAFDKAIAADPTKADAYYQKAVNLLGKATVGKDGKMIAPPEVAEDLNKYLELAPQGPMAESAKALIESLGAKVETSFGKSKGKKK